MIYDSKAIEADLDNAETFDIKAPQAPVTYRLDKDVKPKTFQDFYAEAFAGFYPRKITWWQRVKWAYFLFINARNVLVGPILAIEYTPPDRSFTHLTRDAAITALHIKSFDYDGKTLKTNLKGETL